MRRVRAEPLTAEGFAPFGDVISAGLRPGQAANQGTAVRFDWTAKLDSSRSGARPNLVVFSSIGKALPLEAKLVERHPCSSQMFLPLQCARYLVCVTPTRSDGEPEVSGLRAFVARAGQGINYHRGTWHHPMVALDGPAEFAVLVWEDGTPLDCVLHPLAEPIEILDVEPTKEPTS